MAAEERDDAVEASEASGGQVSPVPGAEHEAGGAHTPKHAGGPAPEFEPAVAPAHAAPLDSTSAPEEAAARVPAHGGFVPTE